MVFIGIFANRLKKITIHKSEVAIFLTVFVVFFTTIKGHGLNRDLASEEIKILESNIQKNALNTGSAVFLIEYYYNKKLWTELIRVAQPQQKILNKKNALMLVEAYLSVQDGEFAKNMLSYIYSLDAPTGQYKILEAKAFVLMAQKEKTDIQKMNYANQAVKTLREAAELEPTNKEIYLSWVDTLRTFWPVFAQDALNVIKVMEQKTNDFEGTIPLKCELFTKAELWDQGVVACQRAIRANPKDVESHLYFSEVQKIKVGTSEKKKILEKLETEFPQHNGLLKKLADLYFEEQAYALAAEKYKKVVESDKEDIESLLYLAQSEFQTKQFLSALEAYKKHCRGARMVASEFKEATKKLRLEPKLHKSYEEAMQSCR